MSPTAALANLGLFLGATPAALRFRRALTRVEATQRRLLAVYLERNRETEIGRRLRFDRISSFEDYRERVPLTTWDDYEAPVARIVAGERAVLTREPVRILEWSSGSTRAAKLIPFTDTLASEFRRAVGAWLADLFVRTPGLLGGAAYWSLSPAGEPPRVEGARVPVGFLDDSRYLGGGAAALVRAGLAVPTVVAGIRDPELHRRATLVALLGRPDLRLISVWHPSFLTLLVRALGERWDALLDDVARGVRVPAVGLALPARPARARALARLGPDRLTAVWPRLGLISCWADGPARPHLPAVREAFPGVRIQGKGLLATEGVVTIPWAGRSPLAVTSHVFELLGEDGRVRAPWELEAGSVHSVVLTTGGGLWRYRLGDRVRVDGFLGGAPCLAFVAKDDNVSDLRGEKLSEGFVQGVLEGLLSRHGVAARFAMLAPDEDGGTPRYVLFLATEEGRPPALDALAAGLEARLRENPHYALCVRLGQLAPAGVASVGPDATLRHLARMTGAGRRLGDVKPTALSNLSGWRDWLDQGAHGGTPGATRAGAARDRRA